MVVILIISLSLNGVQLVEQMKLTPWINTLVELGPETRRIKLSFQHQKLAFTCLKPFLLHFSVHLWITSSREPDITLESPLFLVVFPPDSSALACDSLLPFTCDNAKLASHAFFFF